LRVPGGPEVRLADITTILDGSPVLVRLGLTVAPGEITVLMGPSGAGKTTLVRHLAGLLRPDAGTVRIADRDVRTADEDELRAMRRRMGVLLGGSSLFESSLFASLTVYEKVTYGLAQRGITEAEGEWRALARLRDMQLDDVTGALPAELPAHARKHMPWPAHWYSRRRCSCSTRSRPDSTRRTRPGS
jgi:phospholipid/cholesterol/gamma-HCH transport system ATP-binding protein